MAMSEEERKRRGVKDMAGQKFGEWTVLAYEGGQNWLCSCSCGLRKLIKRDKLLRRKSNSACTACRRLYTRPSSWVDITGQKFGLWTAMRFENGKWECECECGNIALHKQHALSSGVTRGCKSCFVNRTRIDLAGQKIGNWTVISYAGKGKWSCVCDCGEKALIGGHNLRHTQGEHCKVCQFAENKIWAVGRTFGNRTVLSHTKRGKYLCRCECGFVSEVEIAQLKAGRKTKCIKCKAAQAGYKIREIPRLEGESRGKWNVRRSPDAYIRNTMAKNTTLRASDIPQSLVEAKRVHLRVKRLNKELQNGQRKDY